MKNSPRTHAKGAGRKFYFPIYKEHGMPVVMCADDTNQEEAVAYERDFLHKERNGNWLKREGPSYPGLDCCKVG